MTEEVRGDPNSIRKAVNNFRALQFATEELRGNPEFVLKAVEMHWSALRFATVKL